MLIPPGFGTIVPYLFVSNSESYVDIIIKTFGAVELGRSLDPNGRIANCQLRIGTTTFMISETTAQYPPSRSALYIYVEDADDTMKLALENGFQHEMDVQKMPYGDRQGGVRDPSGNIWWISQRLIDRAYF